MTKLTFGTGHMCSTHVTFHILNLQFLSAGIRFSVQRCVNKNWTNYHLIHICEQIDLIGSYYLTNISSDSSNNIENSRMSDNICLHSMEYYEWKRERCDCFVFGCPNIASNP